MTRIKAWHWKGSRLAFRERGFLWGWGQPWLWAGPSVGWEGERRMKVGRRRPRHGPWVPLPARALQDVAGRGRGARARCRSGTGRRGLWGGFAFHHWKWTSAAASDMGYSAGGGLVETRWKVWWRLWVSQQTVGWSRCGDGQATYYSATSPVVPLCRLRLGNRYDFPFQCNLRGGKAG